MLVRYCNETFELIGFDKFLPTSSFLSWFFLSFFFSSNFIDFSLSLLSERNEVLMNF